MKKNLIYILAFISVIFAACNPLKDEINNLKPVANDRTLALTLATADYDLLPTGNYAKKGGYFATETDANSFISVILNSKYPQFGDGTIANVNYNALPAQIKPADSLFANVQYTVTPADYTDAAPVVGNGNFKTYNVAQVIAFLEWKFPKATTPVNKLVLLTYQFFQSNVTTSAGVTVTEAFMLFSGGWQKINLVSAAQYASWGRGINNGLTSADVSSFSSYFNIALKADPSIVSPKSGDIRYISYKYIQSSSISYQRVFTLIYDGANWVSKSVPVGPLPFLRKKGTWIPDPTVYYTLIRADYNVIGASTAGSVAARANLTQFGSFDVSGGANNWSDSDINAGLIVILNSKYSTAPVDEAVLYNLTYALFRGATPTGVKGFAKTATGFVFVPKVD